MKSKHATQTSESVRKNLLTIMSECAVGIDPDDPRWKHSKPHIINYDDQDRSEKNHLLKMSFEEQSNRMRKILQLKFGKTFETPKQIAEVDPDPDPDPVPAPDPVPDPDPEPDPDPDPKTQEEKKKSRLEYHRQWRAKNMEKVRGYSRKYRQSHIEQERARSKEYLEKNRDAINARKRERSRLKRETANNEGT